VHNSAINGKQNNEYKDHNNVATDDLKGIRRRATTGDATTFCCRPRVSAQVDRNIHGRFDVRLTRDDLGELQLQRYNQVYLYGEDELK